MHVDQFSEMGLDPVPYAKIMAEGLAFLWWRARVDAKDVEFVLAGVPGSDYDDSTGNGNDNNMDHRGSGDERCGAMSERCPSTGGYDSTGSI